MSWTQPLCDPCWDDENPELEPREPHRLVPGVRTTHPCCMCGTQTKSGIWIRRDPALVSYPYSDDD